MAHTTHSGRVTGPITYLAKSGAQAAIPFGPCVVEQLDGRLVDICWGESGEESASLSFEALEEAEAVGSLLILDGPPDR